MQNLQQEISSGERRSTAFQEFHKKNVQLVERHLNARESYKLTERTLIRSNAIYATRRSVIDHNSDVIKEPHMLFKESSKRGMWKN